MGLYPVNWLKEYATDIGKNYNGEKILKELAFVGLEEEKLVQQNIIGPVVVGQIISYTEEKQNNGKNIRFCKVDVGNKNSGIRSIVCGANNFVEKDYVVVALSGAVLSDDFKIEARKTYGAISDGMICSFAELGISIESNGIIILNNIFKQNELKIGDDAISLLGLNEETVELNITPDRGYCFSIRGVARELATKLNKKYIDPIRKVNVENYTKNKKITKNKFQLELSSTDCNRFVAVSVENCNASIESPYFIQKRLIDSGMRPISLAVDVTNYVMLEFGTPLHAYDKDTLTEPIIVRKAKSGEKIKTLDEKDRTLSNDDLLITDRKRILGIAGVMGGMDTEISHSTKNILIESANFSPDVIAKSARFHKIPSESSKRFERGVDNNIQLEAALRVAELIIKFGEKGTITDISEVKNNIEQNVIKFDYLLTEKLTGVKISKNDQKQIIKKVGGTVEKNNVIIPSWRTDIKLPVDLVEEIIRIFGYDKIQSELFSINNFVDENDSHLFFEKYEVAKLLGAKGLFGVLSYPFVSKEILNKMLISKDDIKQKLLKVKNPIDNNVNYLRTSILQTLSNVIKTNVSRGQTEDFSIFEISKLGFENINDAQKLTNYKYNDEFISNIIHSVPNQDIYVAGILLNKELKDVFEIVNSILSMFNVLSYKLWPNKKAPFHPTRSSEYFINKESVGYAGALNPKVCGNLNMPENTLAFEINLTKIAKYYKKVDSKTISRWPLAKTDIAFVLDEKCLISDLVSTIKSVSYVEDVLIFDIYKNNEQLKGKQSVAVNIKFRADDKTLSHDDISNARNEIIKLVKNKLNGVIRDF